MNKNSHRGVVYAVASCALAALAIPGAFAQGVSAGSAANSTSAVAPVDQAAPAKSASKRKSADIRLAQTVPDDNAQRQTLESVQQLSPVEITGTHITETSVGEAQPITNISALQIQQSGFTTISQVLQNIPEASNSLTSAAQSDSSNGDAEEINLRALGASRTLVLVDGQRWTPQTNGIVDLSAIPTSIIQSVQVLQDGASAVYGSDAIAGVVNIITKTQFNGAEINAYAGAYDDTYGGDGGLDGRTQEYDLTLGKSDDRSGILFNAQFENTGAVYAQNRALSSLGIYNQTQYDPGFVPPTLSIESPSLADETIGGATCSKAGVCNLQVGSGPSSDPTLSDFVDKASNVTYQPSQFMMSKPDDDTSLYLNTHYRIASNVNFTALAAYNDENSTGQIGSAWSAGEGGAYQVDGAGYGIGANNPYNPFGVDLVGNAAQYCPSAADGCTPNYLLTNFSETIPGTYDRISRDHTTTATIRPGLNGFFNALGSTWDWQVGMNYGKVYDTSQDTGFTDIASLATALDSPGGPQCNGPAQSAPGSTGTWDKINGKYYQILIPGCVPVNPFGGYNSVTGQSALTPAMVDYTEAVNIYTTAVTMRDYTANLTGQLIKLPAGPLAVAVGGESLQNNGSLLPSTLISECLTSLRCIQPTFGRTWTYAEYTEFNVPLLKDLPFANELSVDLAERFSQFRWQGGVSGTEDAGVLQSTSANTGRIQVQWKPVSDLQIHASWSQGFRAPSVSDLYNDGGASYDTLDDPCAPVSEDGGYTPGKPLPVGCDGVEHTQASARIQTATGGNPLLKPESSISRTIGLTYSPNWIPSLIVGADFYKIDINNTIATVSAQYILNECYDENVRQDCNLITLSGTSITNLEDIEENIGSEDSSGVDFNAAYSLPESFLGDFNVSTSWTYITSFTESLPDASTASGFETVDEGGYVGIPKLRGSGTLSWSRGDWSAVWNVQYIGKVFENCSALTTELNECSQPDTLDAQTDSVGVHELGTTIYNDVAVTYDWVPVHARITLGAQDLFNRQWPVSYTAGDPPSFQGDMGYRMGRFLYARIGFKF